MEIKTDLVTLCALNHAYKSELTKREEKAMAYSARVQRIREAKRREKAEMRCHLVLITILLIIVGLVAIFYEPTTPMQAVASESVSGIHYVYVPVE